MTLKSEKYLKKDVKTSSNYINDIVKHPFFGIVLVGLGFFLLQILGLANIISPSTIRFISTILIYYIVGLGFSVLLGYAGLASLGTAGFIGLGSYVFLTVIAKYSNIPNELGFVLAILITIALGAFVGFISLRIEGMYLAIITLGISEILQQAFTRIVNLKGSSGMESSFSVLKYRFFGIEFSQTQTFSMSYYIVVILMTILMILVVNLIKSPTGRAMLAMKNSTSAAQAMGISLVKYRLIAFMIATFTAGLGGILLVLKNNQATPMTFDLALSLNILAIVVVGGMKSIYGVLIGSFVIFGLNDLLLKRIDFFSANPNAYYIVNGVLIIAAVMFYPGGIVKLFTDIKSLVLRFFRFINRKWKEYRYGNEEII